MELRKAPEMHFAFNSITKFGRRTSVRRKKFPHKCRTSVLLYCVAFCARFPVPGGGAVINLKYTVP